MADLQKRISTYGLHENKINFINKEENMFTKNRLSLGTVAFLIGILFLSKNVLSQLVSVEVGSGVIKPTNFTLPVNGTISPEHTYIKVRVDSGVNPVFKVYPDGGSITAALGVDEFPSIMFDSSSIADVALSLDPSTNVFTIDIAHYLEFPLGNNSDGTLDNWILEISHDATMPHWFHYAIGHTDAEAEVPGIKVISEPIDFGEVLIGGDKPAKQTIEIANVGTGNLNISDISLPSHPAFNRSYACTFPLVPQDTCDIEIEFDPKHSSIIAMSGNPGRITPTPTITFTNNSANEESLEVDLPVTLVKLELGLLFDISGSMGWRPDGTRADDHEQTRLFKAKEAGRKIIDLIEAFEGDSVRAALFTFPEHGADIERVCSSAEVIIPFRDRLDKAAFDAAWGTDQGSLQTWFFSPLAKGLEIAYGVPPNNVVMDPGPQAWTEGDFVRRALIILSDGHYSCVKQPGTWGIDDPNSWIWRIKAIDEDSPKYIRVFTIGYGESGKSHVNHGILAELASAGRGEPYIANPMEEHSMALSDRFQQALIKSQKWVESVDPIDNLIKGGATKYHDVCIDDSIQRIAFVLDWEKIASNAIHFELQGPDGIISRSSPDVSYYSSKSYAMYIIKGKTAKGHEGSDKWTFKLSGGPGIADRERINYRYSVIGKSKVKMNTQSDSKKFYTVDDNFFEVKINGFNKKLAESVNVALKYDTPKESYGTWLSSMKGFEPQWLVPPQPPIIGKNNVPDSSNISSSPGPQGYAYQTDNAGEIAQHNKQYAPETIMGEPASMVLRKAYALRHFAKNPFKNMRLTGTIQLYDDGKNGDKVAGDGIYSVYLPNFKYDGLARFGVILKTDSGEDCLRRELWLDRIIDVSIVPEFIAKNIKFRNFETTPFFPQDLPYPLYPEEGMLRKNVVFTPKDQFGNYWGPGHANQVNFTFKNAEPLGPVIDNLDGSYIQVIEYRRGENPLVSITARGVTSPEIKMKPSPSVQFGFKVGLNSANLSSSDLTPMFDWNNRTGFCVGAFLNFKLSDSFTLQTEAFFSRKGLKVDQIINYNNEPLNIDTNTFNIDFIEVPVLLKFLLASRCSISPSIFAGPFAAFKINDNLTPAEGVQGVQGVPEIKTFDFGVTFGAGVEFKLGGGGSTLVFDARYTRGLINIADVPTSTDFIFNSKVLSRVLSFMIGLRF